MRSLKILITNNTLAYRCGTECYVRDIAIALLRQGHKPIAYSSELGKIADELRAATVAVVNDLNAISETPDIIHGQHHLDTMAAMLHFPQTPAIYFCHGWLPWEEIPPKINRIIRYVAVDEVCQDRLLFEHGIEKEKIRLLFNFADLKRFKPRAPLPNQPKKALVFSNSNNLNNYVDVIKTTCHALGIEVDTMGMVGENDCANPEKILVNYDIVFAKARAAIESLAVGNAVIVCDARGMGEMITTNNFDHFRKNNFGIRTLCNSITPETIKKEILRYNAADATHVAQVMRNTVGLDSTINDLTNIYFEALDEYKNQKQQDSFLQEQKAVSAYIIEQKKHLRQAQFDYEQLKEQCRNLENRLKSAYHDIESIRNSKTMRIRDFLINFPLISKFLKFI